MPTSGHKLRVFLCHSSHDKPVVRELYRRLLAKDWIIPWLDEENLLPGQDWGIEIEKAIEIADVVIVCLSTDSVGKEGYIQRELKFALDIALEKPEGTIFIIPLRLDDCQIPRRLHSWQYLDYFPESRRELSYSKLVESLTLRWGHLIISREPLPHPTEAEVTIHRIGDYFGELPTSRPARITKIDYSPNSYVPKDGDLAALLVLEAEDKYLLGEWIAIKKISITVGRATDNDISFPKDSWVSRHHILLQLDDGNWTLSEVFSQEANQILAPANGTFVNNEKVEKSIILHNNDLISLGGVVLLRFRNFDKSHSTS